MEKKEHSYKLAHLGMVTGLLFLVLFFPIGIVFIVMSAIEYNRVAKLNGR